jgi:DNA-nicking Smr family endonuclease
VSEHDDEFARAMADVVPLPADPRGRRARATPAPRSSPPAEPGPPSAPAPDDYAAPGVDRREIRKLRRGEHTVRARLDLHGVTTADAARRVEQFINNSTHARHRCVSIVHGKGLNSAGGVSRLRDLVRDVLLRSPAVLAFAPAPPSHGGSGAVYVLLRR